MSEKMELTALGSLWSAAGDQFSSIVPLKAATQRIKQTQTILRRVIDPRVMKSSETRQCFHLRRRPHGPRTSGFTLRLLARQMAVPTSCSNALISHDDLYVKKIF